MWYVYVLLCADGSFYTGSTNNLAKRFAAHLVGTASKYTRSHKPIKVIYSQELESRSVALKREAEIKKWTRKEKIGKLNL
jgi:putative endonuclease